MRNKRIIGSRNCDWNIMYERTLHKTKQKRSGHMPPSFPQNQSPVDNHFQLKIQFSPRESFWVNKPFLCVGLMSGLFFFSLFSLSFLFFILFIFFTFLYYKSLHVFYGFQFCFYWIPGCANLCISVFYVLRDFFPYCLLVLSNSHVFSFVLSYF